MRATAILTGLNTHLDHLGVLSSVLKIPLIVTDEKTQLLVQQYYPDLDVRYHDLNTLTLPFLAHNFDAIFETGKFWAAELSSSINLLYGKKMRFVFCPHGNSDKGHTLQHHVQQDISLVYGQHLLDLLKRTGAYQKIDHVIPTGNYRLPYYLKHKTFYDALAHHDIFSRFTVQKPIILYAPTWHHNEHPTSFFSSRSHHRPALRFNLLIKLHPLLLEDHPAHTFSITCRYENHPSALFLTDFPPIYPLLNQCALYIGDHSSIGYDFLAFDRPLIFLSAGTTPLSRCGLALTNLDHLNHAIHSELANPSFYAAHRQQTYHYAFGPTSNSRIITHIFMGKINRQASRKIMFLFKVSFVGCIMKRRWKIN